jgi:hypothetical protein
LNIEFKKEIKSEKKIEPIIKNNNIEININKDILNIIINEPEQQNLKNMITKSNIVSVKNVLEDNKVKKYLMRPK